MNVILLFAIGLIWGGQFVLIDFSLGLYTPAQLALIRTFYAILFLIIVCALLKKNWQKRSLYDFSKVILIGVLEVVVPFTLLMWAQKFVLGSTASILMGSIPLYTLIFVLVLGREKISKIKIAAIALGFGGLLLLFLPGLISSTHSSGVLPKLAILIGALSFSLALTVIHSMPKENPFLLSRDAFLSGGIILFFINLYTGNLDIIKYSFVPTISSMLLGVFCSGVVYVLYMVLIKRAGPTYTSFANYLVPVFGSILGVLILKDHFTAYMAFSCMLVVMAVVLEPLFYFLKKTIKKQRNP